jgi:hypothetical protein
VPRQTSFIVLCSGVAKIQLSAKYFIELLISIVDYLKTVAEYGEIKMQSIFAKLNKPVLEVSVNNHVLCSNWDLENAPL